MILWDGIMLWDWSGRDGWGRRIPSYWYEGKGDDSFVLIQREKGREYLILQYEWFICINRKKVKGMLWIQYCIRSHHFVFVGFVFVCIKGMGHDGMVMGNVNVHSFIWKECNYCTSVCFEWNGDGGWDTDFPFFHHLWILINYSNYFLWYSKFSLLYLVWNLI